MYFSFAECNQLSGMSYLIMQTFYTAEQAEQRHRLLFCSCGTAGLFLISGLQACCLLGKVLRREGKRCQNKRYGQNKR